MKPSIGAVTIGTEIGLRSRGRFVWSACPQCRAERWIGRNQVTKICMSCAAANRHLVGEKNPRWNGGIRQGNDGYRYITVYDSHPFIEMAGKVLVHGKYRYYIAEHRLVLAQHLNRSLNPWEIVHHINGIKDDNRIENLVLLKSKQEHLPSMNIERVIKGLQGRVAMLEADNALLRHQLSLNSQEDPELNTGMNREMCRDYRQSTLER